MMLRVVPTALASALLGASSAAGVTLQTDTVNRDAVPYLVCRLENGATVSRLVRVSARPLPGARGLDSGAFVLLPGAVFLSGTGGGPGCRFDVDGSALGLSASATWLDDAGQRHHLLARSTTPKRDRPPP